MALIAHITITLFALLDSISVTVVSIQQNNCASSVSVRVAIPIALRFVLFVIYYSLRTSRNIS